MLKVSKVLQNVEALHRLKLQEFLFRRGFSTFHPKMDKKEHIEQTANNFRVAEVEEVTVTKLLNASPTIKTLTLHLNQPPKSTFKAGQWVDFFIPGEPQVGGFSMWNSPDNFNKTHNIELAVKNSSWAPANWVHNQCKEGDTVSVRFGGDFFYDPTDLQKDDKSWPDSSSLLLIAGGVGINPLLSIFLHARSLCDISALNRPRRTVLMYSATTEEELIFRDIIDCTCKELDNFSVSYHVTGNGPGFTGRITEEQVSSKLSEMLPGKVETFLCGPTAMISDMTEILKKQGLEEKNIHFERWY